MSPIGVFVSESVSESCLGVPRWDFGLFSQTNADEIDLFITGDNS